VKYTQRVVFEYGKKILEEDFRKKKKRKQTIYEKWINEHKSLKNEHKI